MKKDILGFVLMIAGVAGVGIGGRTASGGEVAGWFGVAGGVASLIVAYFAMRPSGEMAPSADPPTEATSERRADVGPPTPPGHQPGE